MKFSWKAYALFFPTVFLTGVFLIAGLSFGNKLFNSPTWRQAINLNSTYQNNLFVAEGEAHLTIIPDQAEILLGAQITNETVIKTQEKANQIINTLQDKLADLGIEKKQIQTKNYTLYPNYDWSENNRRIINYTLTTQLQITLTDFSLLNQVIDLATTNGINQISDINFSLSEQKKHETRQEARKIAIEQAKDNATSLASLTNINLGEIINVEEMQIDDYQMPYTDRTMGLAKAEGEFDAPTNIEAGTNAYNYRVYLSYQTY